MGLYDDDNIAGEERCREQARAGAEHTPRPPPGDQIRSTPLRSGRASGRPRSRNTPIGPSRATTPACSQYIPTGLSNVGRCWIPGGYVSRQTPAFAWPSGHSAPRCGPREGYRTGPEGSRRRRSPPGKGPRMPGASPGIGGKSFDAIFNAMQEICQAGGPRRKSARALHSRTACLLFWVPRHGGATLTGFHLPVKLSPWRQRRIASRATRDYIGLIPLQS